MNIQTPVQIHNKKDWLSWRFDKAPTDACLYKILERSFCLFILSFVCYCNRLLGIEGMLLVWRQKKTKINKTHVVRISRISEKWVLSQTDTQVGICFRIVLSYLFLPRFTEVSKMLIFNILMEFEFCEKTCNYFIKSLSVFTCVQGCQN